MGIENDGSCNTDESNKKCVQNFGQKTKPLERTTRGWEENIKMNFKEEG
jgi:hypothetical protein